jgi:hypothetical protein
MRDFTSTWIECHGCGDTFTVGVSNDLHITEAEGVRQSIIDATFHRFRCAKCDELITVEQLLAYSDFPRQQWFVVVPSKEMGFHDEWDEFAEATFRATMLEHCPPIVRDEIAPQMTRRVIFGLASLREKLVCFDAGLDDRVLEVLKAKTLRDLGLPVNTHDYFYLDRVTDQTLHLDYGVAEGKEAMAVPLPRAAYDKLVAEDVHSQWPEFFGDNLIIDYRVAALSPSSQLWRET